MTAGLHSGNAKESSAFCSAMRSTTSLRRRSFCVLRMLLEKMVREQTHPHNKQFHIPHFSIFFFSCMIGASARILFDKGFVKTIADTTFENIEDRGFCRGASALLRSIQESLKIVFENIGFFTDIREFKLILELLRKHNSDDIICSNVIHVLNIFLINFKFMKILEDTLKLFLRSGIFGIIRSIMERSKNEQVTILCCDFLKMIQHLGETTH